MKRKCKREEYSVHYHAFHSMSRPFFDCHALSAGAVVCDVKQSLRLWVCADGDAAQFAVPLMMASFHQMTGLKFGQHTGSITLIGRRCAHRAGVRHWRRGADSQVPNLPPFILIVLKAGIKLASCQIMYFYPSFYVRVQVHWGVLVLLVGVLRSPGCNMSSTYCGGEASFDAVLYCLLVCTVQGWS